jgi:hypothetical protein
MKQLKISLVAIALLIGTFARADEGMWLPFLLGRNYEDMKKHGLRLTQEEIYDINNSSIKDAIISFGGFCTGEIVSDKGLILTNHHCGYDAIAESSSPEHNYLDDGFWAKDHSQEIPIPGLHATFIIRIEDVSATINENLSASMTEDERAAKIKEISKTLIADAEKGTEYKAFIRDFYEGNEFYLFVKEQFNDIRMVGTPPQSAGKYGGDTDNWMWPRHTADFSMFRIYANKDNKPAQFSQDNVPYTPKHSLPVSLKGVQENDYAMILGFPGSTDRYLSSWGVEQAITLKQPKQVDIRAKKLEIMKSYMDKDVDVRLKYSSKYAQVANYWKYFIGQTAQVKNNDVIGKKRNIEAQFRDYMKNKKMPFDALADMENYYKLTNSTVNINAYQIEFLYTVDANVSAVRYKFWADALTSDDATMKARAGMMAGFFEGQVLEYFEKANMDIEIDIIHDVLAMYVKDVPKDQMGEFTKKIASKGQKGVDKFTKKLRKKSIFVNKDKFESFAKLLKEDNEKGLKALEKDPLYMLIADMVEAHKAATETEDMKQAEDNLNRANRFFVQSLRDMNPKKNYYPNANSTLRLTYGNVLPYSPKDGVTYHYTTTLDGVFEKEDPSNPEFMVDPRMKEVWKKKDYGQYADANGNLIVNFLSNNDITGGNSGSPVINGDGELIGTAFDGNWEAMSGDIYFEPNIQRTISLDIRYTLWLVDKVYGATNIIEEMNLVK